MNSTKSTNLRIPIGGGAGGNFAVLAALGAGLAALLLFALTLLPTNASAEEWRVEDTYTIEAPDGSDPVAFATATGSPALKPGTYTTYRERVDLPDYAAFLYDWLVEATDNDGVEDWLIDDRYFTRTTGDDFTDLKTPGTVLPFSGGYGVSLGITRDKTSDYDRSAIQAAVVAFEYDHPEVFWLSKSSSIGIIGTNAYGVSVYRLYGDNFDLRQEDFRSKTAITDGIALRDRQVTTILDETLTMGATAYTKMKTFENWLTVHNQYNTVVADGGDAPSLSAYESLTALTGASGPRGPVCEGYAKAFKVLCNAAAIPCVVTHGVVAPSYGLHMWNLAKVGDAWHAVDVTWDDPVPANGGDGVVSGHEANDYLLIGANTVRDGQPFAESHQMETTFFTADRAFYNGPALAAEAYDPASAPAQKAIANAVVTVAETTYTGQPVEPAALVTVDGVKLQPGFDYFVTYRDNVSVGTGSLTIVGMEGYTGTKTVEFRIAKAKAALTLTPASLVFEQGGEAATVEVGGADGQTVTATSSDTTVASVTVTGTTLRVKPLAEGNATVTVSIPGNGNVEAATATLPVAVKRTVDVWRLYNKWTGEHLFTTDVNEYRTLSSTDGWRGEGVGWRAPAVSSTQVWRLYNAPTGKHLYTLDANERAVLLASGTGWSDEGFCWYSDDAQRMPVYRLYNPYAPFASAHHYTMDFNEYAALPGQGWNQERVCWYAVSE